MTSVTTVRATVVTVPLEAATAHAVHPIWTDARRVVCQLVVTDCQRQQDAVTATVTF